ncbi:hypothetical protein, partial [Microcoleus sp. F10-A1]|uniref:hypothetical protein n=1 Tax=Microcoleus sp. F10-A1 TaxID=2818750 RepID=UPI002FD70A53
LIFLIGFCFGWTNINAPPNAKPMNVTSNCMKTLLTLTIFAFMTFGCSNKQTAKDEKLTVIETQTTTDTTFRQVANFPTIKDTTQFIKELRQASHLEVHEIPVQKEKERITAYKKVKLYGSDKDFILIEYDWKVGSMAQFPWKHQLLLTTGGKLVKTLSGQRFDLITIFPNQNPFLLVVTATAKGNGGHEIYKVSADTLENVYEGYYDYAVQTFDAHEDLSVFAPNELKTEFLDDNKDGFNDIVFTGEKLMLGKYTSDSSWYDVENEKPFTVKNPASRHFVNYIFLYDKQSGHFKAKSVYSIGN